MGKLFGLTFVLGSAFAGTTYYALNDKDFRKTYIEYVPNGKETLTWIEDLQKNQQLDLKTFELQKQADELKKQANDLTHTAKAYTHKLQESAHDAIDYAKDTYSNLTNGQQKESKPLQRKADVIVKDTNSTLANNKTSTDTTTTIQLSTSGKEAPVVVAVAIEKPEPILVKQVLTNNTTVRELSQIVYELASILNESGLSGLGRDIIKEAETKLEQLNHRFVTLDNEQASILESLRALAVKGGELEGSLEQFHVEASQTLEKAAVHTAEQIVRREAQLKNQFEQTRAEIKATFAQQLAADLNQQAERLEKAREQALKAQAQELQRRFVKEVKLLVEQERAGRLAQLDGISQRFKALEQHTLANAKALDQSRQQHVIHVTLNALEDTLGALHKQPFADELHALRQHAQHDPLIQTVLSVIPQQLAKEGVDTISDLSVRYEQVAEEIRRVALVPEDGAFGSHIISLVMSFLMFKKSGLVNGDDVESILSRTDYYLKRDNLEYATRELNQLTGWPKRLAQDWIQSARRHLEVKQALEVTLDFT